MPDKFPSAVLAATLSRYMRLRRCYWLCAVFILFGQAGCLRPTPPKLNLEKPSPAATKPALASFLQAARFGEWVYERTELDGKDDPQPVRYVRRILANRVSEGIMVNRPLPPLERYLHPNTTTPTSRPAESDEPPPLSAKEGPQLFELEEALEAIPLELVQTNPISTSTTLRFFDRRGHLETTGTLTRRAEIEGLQDVDVPAGHFADCLRIRVQLEIRFPIGLKVDWASYVWLSQVAGEVRRIEELTGAFWIFGFGSAYEFRLLSYDHGAVQSQPTSMEAGAGVSALAPKWRTGLITLNRGAPRPRVSGAVFDFEDKDGAAPASED